MRHRPTKKSRIRIKSTKPASGSRLTPFVSLLILLPIFTLLLVDASGCFSKKTVHYTPTDRSLHGRQLSLGNSNDIRQALKVHYAQWQGTRYKSGGMSRSGIDCSGFTLLTYDKLFGISLPRTVADQAKSGRGIARSALLPGDLIFFKTGLFQKHVGIYLGNNEFMHASASQGVTISNLVAPYWQSQYWQAKRL